LAAVIPGCRPGAPPILTPETVAMIRQMAAANRRWGVERSRGELLNLDIGVAKSTIQRYLRACPGYLRYP
jgi:hypothetical protein